jgi:hypothetical protein
MFLDKINAQSHLLQHHFFTQIITAYAKICSSQWLYVLRHLYSKFTRINIHPEIIDQHTDVTLTKPYLLPDPIILGLTAKEMQELTFGDSNSFGFQTNDITLNSKRCAIIVI